MIVVAYLAFESNWETAKPRTADSHNAWTSGVSAKTSHSFIDSRDNTVAGAGSARARRPRDRVVSWRAAPTQPELFATAHQPYSAARDTAPLPRPHHPQMCSTSHF
ncbi:hypothetical protein EVAR_82861_1 [Eumeta japonica]|uniref:Uncharacterized protein n=1 Tax=Eumeta variegata TaxID=151549 RepID=A0A4C1V430_EUMVA|nr:hypothetical protein EVAR_82861_1 [Eumeta japonica]